MFPDESQSVVTKLENPLFEEQGIEVSIKREDLIHPLISGNKWRKLKYNIQAARQSGYDTICSFGGPFSNHIHALSYAGRLYQFKTIGVIRGEERYKANPTLKSASDAGMHLHFVNREDYRKKQDQWFVNQLSDKFGQFYLLPEGGSNKLAIEGCQEIMSGVSEEFNVVCCSCGTGGTAAGILASLAKNQKLIGFSSLKGNFMEREILGMLKENQIAYQAQLEINHDNHFGGYGKHNMDLIRFINDFMDKNRVSLDPIYTGKMFYGLLDLIKSGYFKSGTKILAIHTGGLQGIAGFDYINGPLINSLE